MLTLIRYFGSYHAIHETWINITSSKQFIYWITVWANFYRYDWLANKTLRAGYFVWAMTAYGSGM